MVDAAIVVGYLAVLVVVGLRGGHVVKNAADFKGKAGRGGSEDFAYISHEIPIVMVGLSAGKGAFPLHHPRVTFDESVLCRGSALLAATAAAYWKRTNK